MNIPQQFKGISNQQIVTVEIGQFKLNIAAGEIRNIQPERFRVQIRKMLDTILDNRAESTQCAGITGSIDGTDLQLSIQF